jgi:WhiB family redox-sensing transcriptional regulator
MVNKDRIAGIDLKTLPPDPSPPDMWQDQAACYGIDPDTFFPTSEEEAGPALAFCGACRIRQTCLAWALKNGERYGVWGGLTEQQRRRVVRFVA